MPKQPIVLDGQSWDLTTLNSALSEGSLASYLERARVVERLGPTSLLGFAACATTGNEGEARSLLRLGFGLDAQRAKAAARIGALIQQGSVSNDPLGFLADVKLSRAQREKLFDGIGGAQPKAAVGDNLTVAGAKKSWDAHKFRRYILDAARTEDPAVLGVAAAVTANLRRHDPEGFVARLTAAQTYPLASGHSTRLAGLANRVLAAAYSLAALDADGMYLGSTRWSVAPATWRAAAAPWVYAILDDTNDEAVGALLDGVHARGLRFVRPGVSPFRFRDNSAELDDARLRLQTCAPHLTKWFDRPMWFDGGPGQVQVLLTQDDTRYLYAWVGVDGRGLLVAFDLVDFLPYGQDVAGVRAAVALALGWFLDVSISLRKSATGTATIRQAAVGNRKAGARYIPSPSFAAQVQQASRGTHSAPRLHGVVAHLRTFTNGYQPSARARQNAPARLRATMKKNQTFVRAHLKGQGNLVLVQNRLSKHSALADVIAALQRRSP